VETTRATTAPEPARADIGHKLSITDFLSDGGFVQLCGTLGELLGAPVRLIDAYGREIEAATGSSASWRVVEASPDAAALAAERAFAVPMRAGGRVIGWVHVGRSAATEGAMGAEVEQAIALIVDVADQVCERELDLRARLRELAATQRLSALLAAAQSEDEVLGIALDSALDLLGLTAGSVVLFGEGDRGPTLQPEERDVEHRVSRNLSDRWLSNPLPLSVGREFDRLALAGEVVAIADLLGDGRVQMKDGARDEGLASALHAGMVFDGQPLGVIRLYGHEVRTFGPAETRVLRTIAHQASVAIGQARLLRMQQAERRHQRQLRLAGDVQRRMLPGAAPRSAMFDIAAHWEPSLELSGDFYDFVELDRASREAGARRIGVVVGDVVGKGVAAALLMSHVRASLLAHVSQDPSPSAVLARVNDDLCRDSLPNEFVTLWYGVADPRTRELVYASAGHDPPIMVCGATGEAAELPTSGMLAGVLPGQSFPEGRRRLEAGDTLVVFTDGLSDARNFDGQRYGRGRLTEAVTRFLAGNPGATARELVHEALWSIRRFAGLAEMPDDQTVVALRVKH